MMIFYFLVINAYMMIKNNVSYFAKSSRINILLILRGVIGTGGIALVYIALPMLPLSEAIILLNTSPPITGILAVLLLKEKYTGALLITTILSIIGVILVAKPAFLFSETTEILNMYPNRPMGTILLLMNSCAASVLAIIFRKLQGVSSNLTMAYSPLIFGMWVPIATIASEVTSISWRIHLDIFVISLFSFISTFLNGRSFCFGKAANVSFLLYSQILFGYIFDLFIDVQPIDPLSALGSIIIFSCLFVNIYKNVKSK